jgi:8-amino-7-oxononanoate synthase
MDKKLIDRLIKRENEGTLRSLSFYTGMVDFFSNDYLGYASFVTPTYEGIYSGTGSRLISGNLPVAEECEQIIAAHFSAATALMFNSGYDANLGFFSSVPQKGDTVVYDALVHASIRDGIRLSLARSYSFKHNDLDDLRLKLKQATGTIYIAVEGIYSMTGDQVPLIAIVELALEFGAYIFLDEAHSAGVFGRNGSGLAVELGVEDKIFARLVTFGKAFGAHGACVLCDGMLRDYLINFAHSFIYTTALPPDHYFRIMTILNDSELDKRRMILHKNIQLLNDNLELKERLYTPILMFFAENRNALLNISLSLKTEHFAVKPIYYPTVPVELEGIRVSLHAFNTKEEISRLTTLLKESCSIQSGSKVD